MAKEIKAPENLPKKGFFVFSAGSIEMGAAENWQETLVRKLPDDITVLNPRRDDWDSSWKQSIDDPQFNEQVTWEMDSLDRADIIAMYFDPNTKSPISLLELGMYARTGKMIVCCPEGFWRKGNVEMVCDRYNIPLVGSLQALIQRVIYKADELTK